MAIIEINLEKPALVEERPATGSSADSRGTATRTATERSEHSEHSQSDSGDSGSSGGKAKIVGLLVALAGAVVLLRRLRGGDDEEVEFTEETLDEPEEEYEYESVDDSGGVKRKVVGALGLVVAALGAVVVARRRGR